MKPSEVLDKAADKLESGEWAWRQGSYGSWGKHQPYELCASEALWYAAVGLQGSNWTTWSNVIAAMKDHLQGPSIIKWNDTLGRTKEEVISTMRAAAQDLRDKER